MKTSFRSMRPAWAALAAAVLAAAGARAEIADDVDYLRRKWTSGATDPGTGLDADGVLAGWKQIVKQSAAEPWQSVKAKMFAFACDRTAIGVSTNDWFPAVAPWSFHRGHPIWKILLPRAAKVDAARSPGLREKIEAGRKTGRWVVWKDYSHSAPDWDYIIALGFPGMRARLLEHWQDTDYYRSRLVAADGMLRFVNRLAGQAAAACAKTPDRRLAGQAAALESLAKGPARTLRPRRGFMV